MIDLAGSIHENTPMFLVAHSDDEPETSGDFETIYARDAEEAALAFIQKRDSGEEPTEQAWVFVFNPVLNKMETYEISSETRIEYYSRSVPADSEWAPKPPDLAIKTI